MPEGSIARQEDIVLLEQVVIGGDLEKLSPPQRLSYYRQVCDSLGLNPLTQPFQYIRLNNRLTLYARRDCTDQLRAKHGVSIAKLEREHAEDCYVVTAYATDKAGRTDSSIGAVPIAGLRGDALANALMKAETKAKRRVTLSIVGLGWLDETEIDTIPEARVVQVSEDGELLDRSTLPGKSPTLARADAQFDRPPTTTVGKSPSDLLYGDFNAFVKRHTMQPNHLANSIKMHYGNKTWGQLSDGEKADIDKRLYIHEAWVKTGHSDGGLKTVLAVIFALPEETSILGLGEKEAVFLKAHYDAETPEVFIEWLNTQAQKDWKAGV